MGWFGASKQELSHLRKTCKASLAAYKACLKANPEDKSPCASLECSAWACLSQKTCPKPAKAFQQCSMRAHAEGTQEGRIRRYTESTPCKRHSDAMRRCLWWKGIWPKILATQ